MKQKWSDLQSIEFLENFLGTLQQHITTNTHSLKYFDVVLASVSLEELTSCWDELPTPFRENKHPLIEFLRISNFDRLLNYLTETDLGSAAAAWKWGPLFECLAANTDLLRASSRVAVGFAVLEGREHRSKTLSSLVESVRRIAEGERDSSPVKEIGSWTVYDNLVIVEKLSTSLTDDGQRESGSWMLGQMENLGRCE